LLLGAMEHNPSGYGFQLSFIYSFKTKWLLFFCDLLCHSETLNLKQVVHVVTTFVWRVKLNLFCFLHDQDLLGSTVARMGSAGGATVPRGTSKGKPTVSDTFRHQLQALVDVLQATNPWWVILYFRTLLHYFVHSYTFYCL
jgi:hypothetical protein